MSKTNSRESLPSSSLSSPLTSPPSSRTILPARDNTASDLLGSLEGNSTTAAAKKNLEGMARSKQTARQKTGNKLATPHWNVDKSYILPLLESRSATTDSDFSLRDFERATRIIRLFEALDGGERIRREFTSTEACDLFLACEREVCRQSKKRLAYDTLMQFGHDEIKKRGGLKVLLRLRHLVKESKVEDFFAGPSADGYEDDGDCDEEQDASKDLKVENGEDVAKAFMPSQRETMDCKERETDIVEDDAAKYEKAVDDQIDVNDSADGLETATDSSVSKAKDEMMTDNDSRSESRSSQLEVAAELAVTTSSSTDLAYGGHHDPNGTAGRSHESQPAVSQLEMTSPSKATDSESAISPMPKPAPPLTKLIIKAKQELGRKFSTKANVAIIVDAENLSNTYLLSSHRLFEASPVLKAAAMALIPLLDDEDDAIKYVFILESDRDVIRMPRLMPLHSNRPVEELKTYTADYRAATAVRNEAVSEGDLAAADHEWIKAYSAFFAIIESPCSNKPRFHPNAGTALPRIEAILSIAQYLVALPAVQSAFNSQILTYISNQTLYPAVAKEAASWLLIGGTLQSEIIYKEAFRHVAGAYPDWPWSKPRNAIPEDIVKIISDRSMDIYQRRNSIHNDLFFLCPSKPTSGFISVRANPAAHRAGVIFTEYIREHLILLQQAEVGTNAETTPTIDAAHPSEYGHVHSPSCLTPAGFYNTLSRGGDAYLPADIVIANEYNHSTAHGKTLNRAATEASMRTNLAALKGKAARIVAPLVKGAWDGVGYLGCVEVVDLPWAVEGMSEDEDEEMVD